eukprot:3938109-Rhodomonas_salina.1
MKMRWLSSVASDTISRSSCPAHARSLPVPSDSSSSPRRARLSGREWWSRCQPACHVGGSDAGCARSMSGSVTEALFQTVPRGWWRRSIARSYLARSYQPAHT